MRRRGYQNRFGTISKEALNEAFKAMRKEGLLARQNFLCCGGCAGYDLAVRVGKKVKEGTLPSNFSGVVFYHRQDTERMVEGFDLHVRYGEIEADGKTFGKPTVEVGKIVQKALEDQGLPVRWDGDPSSTIIVLGPRTTSEWRGAATRLSQEISQAALFAQMRTQMMPVGEEG